MFRELARRVRLFVACVISVTAVAAVVGSQEKPRPAPAAAQGQRYDAEFVFDKRYAGTMTLRIGKGSVTGTMLIDTPTRVDGEVAGTLKGNALVLEYDYTIQEEGCTGRVRIEATMSAKRSEASGTAHATGCGDHPMNGTVTLKRAKP